MRKLKLVIEYDGTAYCGWQRQAPGFSSVQQTIEEAIERIVQEKIKLLSAGRTDAGVHAIAQVAHFRTSTRLETRGLLLGLNSLLPPDISIKSIEDADAEFHSRYSAVSKVYLYRVLNSRTRSGLNRNYAWFVHEPLDIESMREAASYLRGRHDFSSFCGTNNETNTYERTVLDLDVRGAANEMVLFQIEANGFLKYMVRNIVGSLVHVGKGKLTPDRIKIILESRDRTQAGPTAPPQGLFLMKVNYQ